MKQNIVDVRQEGQSGGFKLPSDNKTAERFVAFLDIMGFKDRVARSDHNDLLNQLSEFNKDIISYIGKYQNSEIQLAQFSDSIVLFSNDDSIASLDTLAEVTRGIMQSAINRQIPIKGAIARGVITCDFPKQLFFGQALIDAYLLEENINYYGILVHHTAENAVINSNEINNLFKDIKAPLKSGKISHYELSWYLDDDNMKSDAKIEEINEALKGIRETVSDAPRKYIDNTLDVIGQYYV